ncbi:MAG: T9SS type A sorting domain-containing protein, partial [Ignavibacteriaceae bacterium]
KILMLLILVACPFNNTIQSQSFNYSGPSTVTINYGDNSVQATFYFYYNLPPGLVVPKLGIELDGNLLAGAICQGGNPYLPSSYTFTLVPGNHTVKFTLASLGETEPCESSVINWQTSQQNVTAKFKVRTENIFTGGIVHVDNLTENKTAPFDRTSFTGDNFQIGAIDQTSGGYNWIWNTSGIYNSKWEKIRSGFNPTDYSYSRNSSYTVQSNDNNTRLRAGLRKILNNVTFQNSFVGIGNGGIIKVNGVQYNSPKIAAPVIEAPVTGLSSTTGAARTFYPPANTTYTASYSGKPLSSYLNVSIVSTLGQYVKFTWNDHPNTNVTQYQIWRKVKHNGIVGPPQLIATKNRGTTSYTDYDYIMTNGSGDLVWYDVRSYYSTENVYADPSWIVVYGELLPKSLDSTLTSGQPLEFSISSFPNPFNPSTKITYSIAKDADVTVKIYDMLGREVEELVNDTQPAGYYDVNFDAKNLSSGVYIYRITASSNGRILFTNAKQMLLMK